MTEPTKRCTKCLQPKPLDAFYRKRQSKDGLRPNCKACHNAAVYAYRARNPESVQAYQRAYWLAHREQYREKFRRWYYSDPDYQRQRVRDYRRRQGPEYRERERLRIAAYRARQRAERAVRMGGSAGRHGKECLAIHNV